MLDADESALLWWHAAAVLLSIICLTIFQRGLHSGPEGASREELQLLSRFKQLYLPGYLLATAADWIQGPYQFKVYLKYGLSEAQIGQLYIAGFGSSLTLGTYAASLADIKGRKTGCLWYCLACSLSCLTKNSPNFYVLMAGRVLGGVAASLLFACFESWCVTAASASGLSQRSLASLFTIASFLNSLSAILAAVLGHCLAVTFASPLAISNGGNTIAPFNAVPILLLANAAYIWAFWDENYGIIPEPINKDTEGDEEEKGGGLLRGVRYLMSEPLVSLLGAINSLFDAALYIFIFQWTLALERRSKTPQSLPHGIMFALFMGWCMSGALACKRGVEWAQAKLSGGVVGPAASRFLVALLMMASIGLAPAAVSWSDFGTVFNGFCLLEFAFGAYSPVAALLRAVHIAETHRSATTALYRVPTNLAVCMVLFSAGTISETTTISLCIALLFLAVVAALAFISMGGGRRHHSDSPYPSVTPDPHSALPCIRSRGQLALSELDLLEEELG